MGDIRTGSYNTLLNLLLQNPWRMDRIGLRLETIYGGLPYCGALSIVLFPPPFLFPPPLLTSTLAFYSGSY